ncbi:hypothetical protein [Amycolatopsis sp. NPDC021455]|uniref:hypothetical protein n=1 Tax=Amycolatopsis sp. NPDC021455 TaxID=3154901 RepID=UPI0033C5110F
MRFADGSTRTEQDGSPIDIRDARIRMTEQVHFVDENGVPVGRSPDDIEIAREDLSRILADALPETSELRLSESVTSIAEHDDRVDAGFASGNSESYDLVLCSSRLRRVGSGPQGRRTAPRPDPCGPKLPTGRSRSPRSQRGAAQRSRWAWPGRNHRGKVGGRGSRPRGRLRPSWR